MSNGNSNKKQTDYKWIAGGLGALLLACISAAVSHHLTQMYSLNGEDVREIVKEETINEDRMKGIIKESFTDISNTKGMYALEGRPRIESIEKQLEAMQQTNALLTQKLVSIETKLDELKP